MPLKHEFDQKNYWIVLVRGLTGALLGSVPGVIYILAAQATLASDVFGVQLILTGTLTGALILSLSAHAAVLSAAIKSRGTGPGKPRTLKDYQQVETLPVIPPASKPAETARKVPAEEPAPTPDPTPVVTNEPVVEKSQPAVEERKPVMFEDFDQQPEAAR